jgi:predicted glycoside hydrolase/deacetylase ChbG (UPF0249 family)
MSRRLVVNADDFGWTPGINRGVAEAHERGVVTSASLIVDAPFAEEAARLALEMPGLALGLHAADPTPGAAELRRQVERFRELLGRAPTHLDSHHHVHGDPTRLPAFREVAAEHGLRLRGHSGLRVVLGFYGQRIGVDDLARALADEAAAGDAELCCHPGYVDEHLVSSYREEREIELRTLCDPGARRAIEAVGFELASHADVPP